MRRGLRALLAWTFVLVGTWPCVAEALRLPWACGDTYMITQDGNGCGWDGCSACTTIGDHGQSWPGSLDFGMPSNTVLLAAAAGTVTVVSLPTQPGDPCYAGSLSCCGQGKTNYLVVDHGDGTSTLYAHINDALVGTGAWVAQGDPIALSGSTGCSTGPHLHFQLQAACAGWCATLWPTFEDVSAPLTYCAWVTSGNCGPPACDPAACAAYGAICCPGIAECVNPWGDAQHCGACDVACGASEVCANGNCAPAPCDPDACAAFGAICCPNRNECINPWADPAHCGGCGVACDPAEVCGDGACEPAPCDPDACAVYGAICCPGRNQCVDPWTDLASCGGCGRSCAPGVSCSGGRCDNAPATCDSGACGTTGTTCCPGEATCVDTRSDPAHCGACDLACPAGQGCVAGRCEAGAACDAAICAGWGALCCAGETGCVDPGADPDHCGGCGSACPLGVACRAGVCEAAAAPEPAPDAAPADVADGHAPGDHDASQPEVTEHTLSSSCGCRLAASGPEDLGGALGWLEVATLLVATSLMRRSRRRHACRRDGPA